MKDDQVPKGDVKRGQEESTVLLLDVDEVDGARDPQHSVGQNRKKARESCL